MADRIGKLNYEPGDKNDTSDRTMTCPNGHKVRQTRGGHFACPQCRWSSTDQVTGAKPVEVVSKNQKIIDPRNPSQSGVQVISGAGIEQRGRRPNVFGQ